MKRKPNRSDVRTRELPPRIEKTKKGASVLCPFCNPTHPILPGQKCACGTILRITAVQPYLTSHAVKQQKLYCLKCKQTGGQMVMSGSGYIHLDECAPDTKLLTAPPKMSSLAKAVYKMPSKVRARFELRYGSAKELQEIDAEGKPTGKILGYFFWKE